MMLPCWLLIGAALSLLESAPRGKVYVWQSLRPSCAMVQESAGGMLRITVAQKAQRALPKAYALKSEGTRARAMALKALLRYANKEKLTLEGFRMESFERHNATIVSVWTVPKASLEGKAPLPDTEEE